MGYLHCSVLCDRLRRWIVDINDDVFCGVSEIEELVKGRSLLLLGAESFVLQFATQKCKDQDI
jgi:hypothetical protein